MAGRLGGGIYNQRDGERGTVIVRASTTTANTAGRRGGGIYNHGVEVFVSPSSSVSCNTPDDCYGTTAS